ncbi:MAG TPA: SDR family oxidoreductase [Phototrophicaceae bacterium]|jgi:NAD(P)-dependent dehydrogenase (short-subunit alcohol dehydrogenase family)|nr:SDR family oxidoreductase [Phototrophicaceae bacterium]
MTTTSTPVAVITGAGQGLGRAVALRFIQSDILPVLVGRTPAKLEAVQAEIEATGGKALIYTADVSDSAQVEQLRARLAAEFDHIDMLVNCAGESMILPLAETNEDTWDHVLNMNLKAPYLMSRALLPMIHLSPNGSIINVVSKVALQGYANVTAYSAAKTGLLGFTRSLAAELREAEIRVAAICPGPMDTPMRWNATPDFERKVVISPDLVAESICQLVSLPRGVTAGEILIQSMHYD